MVTGPDTDDVKPRHAASATDHALVELQLYGHRPFQDDPDPRPLPDETAIRAALADVFDALVVTLTDTRLEEMVQRQEVEIIAQTAHMLIPADSVDHKSASDRYAARARAARKIYDDHLAADGADPGTAPLAVADVALPARPGLLRGRP